MRSQTDPSRPGGPPDAAQLYEWECRHVLRRTDQDVGRWVGVATERGGAVLELACGTGRLTFPIAEAGVAIVGLDNDVAMLATARRRRRRDDGWPLFLAGDMRRFALAARFSLVLVAYNSLQLLPGPAEMTACLSRARQHLAPDGRVGVEVTDFQSGGADGPVDGPVEALGDAEGIQLSGELVHDLTRRTSRYARRFTGAGWSVEDVVVVRSLDRPELEAVLGAAGLVATTWWAHGETLGALATIAPAAQPPSPSI